MRLTVSINNLRLFVVPSYASDIFIRSNSRSFLEITEERSAGTEATKFGKSTQRYLEYSSVLTKRLNSAMR